MPPTDEQPSARDVCFTLQEWTHVLIWDLFVGRYIWLDGRHTHCMQVVGCSAHAALARYSLHTTRL